MLPELHACREAEDFFEALQVPFDPRVLDGHRVPLLRRFGELLVEVSDRCPDADDGTLRAQVRAALQEVYAAARLGRLPGRVVPTGGCGGCMCAASRAGPSAACDAGPKE